MVTLSASTLISCYILWKQIPKLPDNLDVLVYSPPTTLYSSDGRVMFTFGGRDMAPLERISPHFLNAITAVEDKNFYRHHGLDKPALARSIFKGIFTKKRIAGGSTITQQLAKNFFFSFERSVLRKMKEALIAFQIESTFSKDEILEAYCNQISFGSRAYGVERASRTFFDKSASRLTLGQASLLAGLPNSPSRFNPFTNPDNARLRQRIVLSLMQRNGMISEERKREALEEPWNLVTYGIPGMGSWYSDRVMEQLEELFSPEVAYFGGLHVFTAADQDLQAAAEKAVTAGLESLKERTGSDSLQAALAAVSTQSGAVLAIVGGKDYRLSQFDRAVKAKRRPGSGFKPFLYYTAVRNLGFTPAAVVLDSPVVIITPKYRDWEVNNFDDVYYGPVTLKFALSKSLNSVAARLVELTGAEAVVSTAHRFGVKSELEPSPTIALGTSGVSPLEMASAFSVIASGGSYHEPFFISRVEDSRGGVLYEHFITGQRSADPDLTYILLDMMKEVVNSGTGVSARKAGFNRPAAGKTGTTKNYKDSWFTGFTPTLCASVWVGYDIEHSIIDKRGVGITGADGGLPIWISFMKKAVENEPPRDFIIPPGVKFVSMNPFTGIQADSGYIMQAALPEGSELPQTPMPPIR